MQSKVLKIKLLNSLNEEYTVRKTPLFEFEVPIYKKRAFGFDEENNKHSTR
jgi:hypothetical protein